MNPAIGLGAPGPIGSPIWRMNAAPAPPPGPTIRSAGATDLAEEAALEAFLGDTFCCGASEADTAPALALASASRSRRSLSSFA